MSPRGCFQTAKSIVQRLQEAGFTAFFAGGWVRDYLLEHPSDDIDIATKASPEEVMSLFSHTIPVGQDFGVVIVVEKEKAFEVTSFRKDGLYLYGRRPESIDYATPEEDAHRRDFTINGMFYDPVEDKVHDHVGGRDDLKKNLIKAIGNPHARFREDRLRMIRAVRMAARFGFRIEAETERAILDHADTLFPAVAVERVWQEFGKMVLYPGMEKALTMLYSLGLLRVIFPELEATSLKALKKLEARLKKMPKLETPIFHLAELFPEWDEERLIAVFDRYRISGKEKKLLHESFLARQYFKNASTVSKKQWVEFYSLDSSEMLEEIYGERNEERRNQLAKHIERAKKRKPLVTSAHLKSRGIAPGVEMGKLLKKAEEIVIEKDIESVEEALHILGVDSSC